MITMPKRYLKHLVDIVHVTVTYEGRTETKDEDVKAFVSERKMIVQSATGNRLDVATVVFLSGDETIAEGDEIIFDGEQAPVIRLLARRTGRSSTIHHYEAILG